MDKVESVHQQVLQRFGKSVEAGKAVCLVGAGVSMPAPSNLPSWPALLEKMAAFAQQYSQNIAGLIRELASEGKLLEAADMFAVGDKIPKSARARFFADLFGTNQEHVTDICKDIAALGITTWITTNFDNNLRYALKDVNIDVFGNTRSELQSALSFIDDKSMLVHLHGRALAYDTLVYSAASYREYTHSEVYKQLLRRLFSAQSVLAIGFSFSDPPFQEALRFVLDELGGHTTRTHVAILPQASTIDKNLLSRTGFECILYDSSAGHDYARVCLKELRRSQPAPASAKPFPTGRQGGGDEFAALVSAFLSLTNPDRGSTYDTASASIVATELQQGPLDDAALCERLADRLSVTDAVAESLTHRGLAYLGANSRVQQVDAKWSLVTTASQHGHQAHVVDAICTRMMSIDLTVRRTADVEQAVRHAITYVMMAQGMAAAQAFVNIDRPDMYAIGRLVRLAADSASIKMRWRQCLAQALMELLHEPSEDISRELFRLASAAFALESVFLNPHGVDLGRALRWRVYLDSNVVLRILDQSGQSGSGFQEFIERLRRLRAPVCILGPFVEEIVGNVNLVERQLGTAGATTSALVEKLCEQIPRVERSPILNWYLWGLRTHRWNSFEQFVVRSHLENVDVLSRHLEDRYGITTEGRDAIKQYDNAERETIWSELREWRSLDADSTKGRRLRRAEATQVLHLSNLRRADQRAWFISIDGQLRRALKYVLGGKYAGYVVTPGVWLLRLNTLHWGEVDVSGFSELMWAVPRQAPLDRIRAMVMTRVLKAEPDLQGENPDWLREHVEAEFSDVASVVAARLDSAGAEDEEVVISEFAEQLVEPSAHRILDELARRREQRRH